MFKKVLANEYFQKKMQAITFQVTAKEYVQKNASDY